jgi:hypothetical protein
MKNRPAIAAKQPVQEIEPRGDQTIDYTKFKQDLSENELHQLLEPLLVKIPVFPPFILTIDSLSATKTIGRGRTNLTLIVPTILQTDATTPSASFDMSKTPSRNPTVQMHFEPIAYGITSVENYFMQFSVQTFGQATFNLSGFAGAGTVLNGGTKVVNGSAVLTLVLQNVPPAQQTFGFLEQTAGAPWSWFSTAVRFPPIVIKP